MKPAENEWYIGIDLGSRWTQVSCYGYQMKEPETRSMIAGKDLYRIPTAIGVTAGKWCFGEEAERLAECGDGIYIDRLLERALAGELVEAGETIFQAEELFLVFFRKILRIALPSKGVKMITRCVCSVEKVTSELVSLLEYTAEKLGMDREQLIIQDYRESFYAYAVSQKPELWQYEVLLFEETAEGMMKRTLSCNKKTIPQVAGVTEENLGVLPQETQARDMMFAGMLEEAFQGTIISAVYLIGSGFEGGWMKESLQIVCRGKRAFQGKNLYTRGACYAGMMDVHMQENETVYFCGYKTKQHVLLKIYQGDETYFYPLVEAGRNLHQVLKKECCILLEGEPVLDLWIQEPGSRNAKIKSLELQKLKTEEKKRCRLKLRVDKGAEEKLLLHIQDIGLGELVPGSNREWEYELE